MGKSHFDVDPDLAGSVHELRIYDSALPADAVRLSGRAGPAPSYLEP